MSTTHSNRTSLVSTKLVWRDQCKSHDIAKLSILVTVFSDMLVVGSCYGLSTVVGLRVLQRTFSCTCTSFFIAASWHVDI